MFFLVNKDSSPAASLMKKMSQEARPGALIQCTKEEFDSFKNGDFEPVALSAESNKLIEVDLDKKYILFADNSTNIDDVASLQELGLRIGIIRVDK